MQSAGALLDVPRISLLFHQLVGTETNVIPRYFLQMVQQEVAAEAAKLSAYSTAETPHTWLASWQETVLQTVRQAVSASPLQLL